MIKNCKLQTRHWGSHFKKQECLSTATTTKFQVHHFSPVTCECDLQSVCNFTLRHVFFFLAKRKASFRRWGTTPNARRGGPACLFPPRVVGKASISTEISWYGRDIDALALTQGQDSDEAAQCDASLSVCEPCSGAQTPTLPYRPPARHLSAPSFN